MTSRVPTESIVPAEKATIRLSFFAGIFIAKKYATKMLVNSTNKQAQIMFINSMI
jgi:hypothetical protein